MGRNNTPKGKWTQQYIREYNRVQQAIYRQKKIGYYVPDDVKPVKPSQMKTITKKDVDKLISLTPQKIRKKSIYVDQVTGEIHPGLDVVKSRHKAKPSTAKVRTPSKNKPKKPSPKTTKKGGGKSRKPKKKKSPIDEPRIPPKETNLNTQIIADITEKIESFDPSSVGWSTSFKVNKKVIKSQLQAIWEDTLDSQGEYEVAYRLNGKAEELNSILDTLFYSSDSTRVDFNMGAFMTLIKGEALTQQEADWLEDVAENVRNEGI